MSSTVPEVLPAPKGGLRNHPVAPAALAILGYVLFGLLLPVVPFHPHSRHAILVILVAALVIPTACFMLLQLWLGFTLVSLRPSIKQSLLLAAGAVALWLATLFWIHPHPGGLPGVNLILELLRPVLAGLFVTVACSFAGMALSRIVREPNVLLPVALIAMPVDYVGAMTNIGFTHTVEQKHPNIVQAVSVPVPTMGGLHSIAFIGPGDALFVAFFLAAVLRMGLNMRGTFWGMYGLLTLTMLIVLTTGLPIAALVPMGLAVLIANGRLMRLQRAEVFATLYAVGLVFAVVVGFYALSHTHLLSH
jgi:hypothetical protein